MIYVCHGCLPIVDYSPGPEDARECACCGRALECKEVDPKDLILTCQAYEKAAQSERPPVQLPLVSSTSGAPTIPPLAGVPVLPVAPSQPPSLPPFAPPAGK